MLLSLLGSQELVDSWWQSPNKYFGYDTPQQAWNTEPEKVTDYIMNILYR